MSWDPLEVINFSPMNKFNQLCVKDYKMEGFSLLNKSLKDNRTLRQDDAESNKTWKDQGMERACKIERKCVL